MKDKAYEITRNPKYYGYQRALESMVYIIRSGANSSVNMKSWPKN